MVSQMSYKYAIFEIKYLYIKEQAYLTQSAPINLVYFSFSYSYVNITCFLLYRTYIHIYYAKIIHNKINNTYVYILGNLFLLNSD